MGFHSRIRKIWASEVSDSVIDPCISEFAEIYAIVPNMRELEPNTLGWANDMIESLAMKIGDLPRYETDPKMREAVDETAVSYCFVEVAVMYWRIVPQLVEEIERDLGRVVGD